MSEVPPYGKAPYAAGGMEKNYIQPAVGGGWHMMQGHSEEPWVDMMQGSWGRTSSQRVFIMHAISYRELEPFPQRLGCRLQCPAEESYS